VLSNLNVDDEVVIVSDENRFIFSLLCLHDKLMETVRDRYRVTVIPCFSMLIRIVPDCRSLHDSDLRCESCTCDHLTSCSTSLGAASLKCSTLGFNESFTERINPKRTSNPMLVVRTKTYPPKFRNDLVS